MGKKYGADVLITEAVRKQMIEAGVFGLEFEEE